MEITDYVSTAQLATQQSFNYTLYVERFIAAIHLMGQGSNPSINDRKLVEEAT